MIAYVDSSVLLRMLFGEPHPLREWERITMAYACRLLPLEVARVIDRCRLEGRIDDEDVARLHQEANRVMQSIEVLELTDPILMRASAAMPTILGTLDAIHLCTALELEGALDSSVTMATHDAQLGRAALASGLEVCGT